MMKHLNIPLQMKVHSKTNDEKKGHAFSTFECPRVLKDRIWSWWGVEEQVDSRLGVQRIFGKWTPLEGMDL